MTEKPSVDFTAKTDPAHRLYIEMLKRADVQEMRSLLGTFVSRGDIDVLRMMLDSGLVIVDKSDVYMLACVQPLVDAVPASEKARAEAFVADWRAAFGPVDHDKLNMQLATATETAARLLISLGADPNGFGSSTRNITALGRTYSIRHWKSALVMLESLAAKDELPLQAINVPPDATVSCSSVRKALITEETPQEISYFHGLLARIGAKPDGTNIKLQEVTEFVRDMFATIDISDSWRKDIARSLVKATASKGLRKDGPRAALFGEFMVQAQFGSAIDFRNAVSCFAADLIRENCVGAVTTLANRLVEMGWHPDEILVPSPGALPSPQELTWLQAAVFHDKRDIVMALLEAGADPDKRSYDGTGVNACDLAEQHPETLPVLMAWKAKNAVDSIIRNGGLLSNIGTASQQKA